MEEYYCSATVAVASLDATIADQLPVGASEGDLEHAPSRAEGAVKAVKEADVAAVRVKTREKELDKKSVRLDTRFSIKSSGLFIEADSLILHLLSLKHLDSDNDLVVDRAFGRPTLHVLFIIQKILKPLCELGLDIHILFFENHKATYDDPRYLLLRDIVQRDLTLCESHKIYARTFASIYDREFWEFLQNCYHNFPPEIVFLDVRLKTNKAYTELLVNKGLAVGFVSALWSFDSAVLIFEPNRRAMDLSVPTRVPATTVSAIAAGVAALDGNITARIITVDSVLNLIRRIGIEHPKFALLVRAHQISLMLQSVLDMRSRCIAPGKKVPWAFSQIAFAEYHLAFCAKARAQYFLDNNTMSSVIAPDSRLSSSNTMYFGDLWDGRLLASVYFYLLELKAASSPHGTEETESNELLQALVEHFQRRELEDRNKPSAFAQANNVVVRAATAAGASVNTTVGVGNNSGVSNSVCFSPAAASTDSNPLYRSDSNPLSRTLPRSTSASLQQRSWYSSPGAIVMDQPENMDVEPDIAPPAVSSLLRQISQKVYNPRMIQVQLM